ncbi:hypothetical protein Q669_28835 [Labrenzia sp. C1B10]|nr:hypothetical protein Q669_28835 [Labrenzia sp. C1B10]ERS06894.1 hypothetical protein Q675_24690 [Labrenzia sp. C1B70]
MISIRKGNIGVARYWEVNMIESNTQFAKRNAIRQRFNGCRAGYDVKRGNVLETFCFSVYPYT